MRRLPLHAGDDRLLGGLDLAATLQAGRPVAQNGLLAEADGGVVVLAMAERIEPGAAPAAGGDGRWRGRVAAGRIVAVAAGALRYCRLGRRRRNRTNGRRPSLLDRMAFHVDLTEVSLRDIPAAASTPPIASDVFAVPWRHETAHMPARLLLRV